MLDQTNISEAEAAHAEPPYLTLPGDTSLGCVLVCDHASNRVPEEYANLGMPDDQMERHIAYDPGAAGVTERLSRQIGAPAVLANFSRLLIDPNRGEDDPTLVMRLSDGAVVPGNATVGADEIERRKALYYDPYHRAVDAALDRSIAAGKVPAILSIHTFTESWRGRPRPWHAAILWDKDPRLAKPLISALSTDTSLLVGDNEPYTGILYGDCMYRHATRRGLAHALVEIRQDLVRHEAGQEEWAHRLAEVMRDLLDAGDRHNLHKIEYFGSWTDGRHGAKGRKRSRKER